MSLTLSTRLSAVRGSAIRDLLTLTARPHVLSLAGGLPAADALPRARIAEAAARALADPAAAQYCETTGIAVLREVVAAHESARIGRPVGGGDVVVTSGSQQALDLVARALLDPGDPVVVEDPVYVGALQVLQAAGAAVHAVPVDEDGLRVDLLAERLAGGLRPRLVHTVASFHNPRGVTLSQERRRALAGLAERYGFLVVEDDPYGLLAFDGAPPTPVAAHGDRVVRLGSASKVLAPALRVGWLTGPAPLTAAVERLKQSTDLCGSALTQAITAELLADEPWFAAHLDGLRAANRERAAALTAAIDTELGGVRRSTPTGGMFVWLDFDGPDAPDTTALLPRAVENGVGFVPGSAFSVDAGFAHSARVCFATYPPDELREAVRRLARSLS
ncbi:PLP-dependent aminotransferase family protein [Pseudonocardia oroxyli]|uniref:2-aminoadipate transaminase n=1 Tax=Pseudonocardia oroxyli TaxID=366584 RepID=A0A1G7IEG8_PSEOR|nr:PLP-dependent aminotransferase family protein [Pseudonocardia oroxyli]SDF11127.1 2-aminoadipate transaminase [Pseudonocardia oroxyli]